MMYCFLGSLLLASMAIECNGAHTREGQAQGRMNHRPLLSNIRNARKLLRGSSQLLADAGISAGSKVAIIPLQINMFMNAMRDTNFAEIIGLEEGQLLGDRDWGRLATYVRVTRDDSNGDIQTLESFPSSLDGTIDFTAFPDSVTNIVVSDTKITGPLDLSHLPLELQLLRLSYNHFSGSIDFLGSVRAQEWPPNFKYLQLDHNNFHGTLDLSQLPASLLLLYANSNDFTQFIVSSSYPPAIQEINLQENPFVGDLDLRVTVPQSLRELLLPSFAGDADVHLQGIADCDGLTVTIDKRGGGVFEEKVRRVERNVRSSVYYTIDATINFT